VQQSIIQAVAAVLLAASAFNAPATPSNADGVIMHVEKNGDGVDLYAELSVRSSLDQTWEVLVDYDRMAAILSKVDESRIVERKGNQFEVVQKSRLSLGPLSIPLYNRRRVELFPRHEIRSHLIEGDVSSSDFTTSLVEEGDSIRIIWRGRIVPGALAGLAISPDTAAGELRELCQELRTEILRRTNPRFSPKNPFAGIGASQVLK
jgi:carbon monoxide dehydrogenase subunit G